MIDLLRNNGPFFKANLHCHTDLSDGRMTAEQVAKWYKAHGYSIVAFTDHSKYAVHSELCSDDFIAIAGVESSFLCLDPNNKPLKYKLCHINFLAKDPATSKFEPEEMTYETGVINRYIAKMKRNGFLCTLNHPEWSLQSTEEINSLEGLDGFEVYNNHGYVLDNSGNGQSHYTIFINSGKRAWAVATDDNHVGFLDNGEINKSINDTCGGWIMVSMPKLSYENFIKAFESGSFYASSGPELYNVFIDEERDVLVVDCSPVKHLLVKGIHTMRAFRVDAPDDSVTHAEIPLGDIRKKEPLIRIEAVTSDMKRAYSQPYWFD